MAKTAFAHLLVGIIPLGLYLLQISGFDYIAVEPIERTLAIPVYLCLVLIGFLGWRLNQSRILMIVLLLIGAYHASLHTELLVQTGIGKIRLRQILSFAFPAAILLVFLTREARLLSKQSLLRLVLALSPIVLMSAWFIFSPESFHSLVSWTPFPLCNGFRIPQLSIIAIFALMIVFFRNKDKKINAFMGATIISLIPFFTMAHIGLTYGIKHSLMAHTVISFSAICIILLHSILRIYWQRVYVDELTDISNRRALDESLATIDGVYSIAMIDIDHFKKFNDTYGHEEGDNVLRFVASVIGKIQGGKAYRYGGEEFCAVFKKTSTKDASDAAENVRKKLAERKFFIRTKKVKKATSKDRKKTKKSQKTAKVTISVGIAGPDRNNPTPDKVLKLADNALYKAKKTGRNRVVTAQ
jgi:diguanylate cyclase (GGDEF)-like protein